MNESPQQYFLTQAGMWLDLYGHFSCESHLRAITFKIKRPTGDPSDLIKRLALYIGVFWREAPEVFTGRVPDLVALPDAIPTSEGVEYDKEVLNILAGRCARLPRREDINWYVTDVEFPDTPNNSDEIIIDTITCYSAALPYATSPEEEASILDVLLSSAWELYLRAWENSTR